MFRFQHIEHLYYLGGILFFMLLFILMLSWRNAKLKKMGDAHLVKTQLRGFISGRSVLKFILLLLAFSTGVIGWANLQQGKGLEQTERRGLDVMIALDVSKSMLATDIKPNRLARAKQFINALLDKMKNDRLGLIVFAGRSYLQVPLTVDYSAVKMMLQNVGPSDVPTQGTVIGDAVERAIASFSQKEKKYKTLIIISDGEDHDETVKASIEKAVDEGIVIHTVGIGSPQGTTLYDPQTKAMKIDEEGNQVISKLNEDELKMIAREGNGTYSLLANADAVAERIIDEIEGMEQKNLGVVNFNSYESYFQIFLGLSVLLLLIEWLLPGANFKNKKTIAG